ncbi:prepilin peptidase [Candidatus Microgenomates bacterium]|nr:MAG: prepilin peptidase [Candidatus Microgenomates bacterium]
MLLFLLIFVFIFGICVGSFLNVLIDRLPENESPFKGRSHCDHCRKTLQAQDLIPLLSFVTLSGKCRYCHKKLSWQYPAIEFLTGLLFVGLFWWLVHELLTPELISLVPQALVPNTLLSFIALVTIFSSLLVIFMTDLKTQIIPDEMTFVLGLSALLYRVVTNTFTYQNILAALATGLLFYGMYRLTKIVLKREGMGFGDVKLVVALGLLLGGIGTVVALYVAFLTGAAVSLILILAVGKTGKTQIAFAPFLIFGTVISFFMATHIFNWYLQLLF